MPALSTARAARTPLWLAFTVPADLAPRPLTYETQSKTIFIYAERRNGGHPQARQSSAPRQSRRAARSQGKDNAKVASGGASTPGTAHGGYASMDGMPTDHEAPSAGISARLTSPSAVSADPPMVNDYDSFAGAYSAENETSLINAYYERPAMLALAGDVAGRRILDVGCGSGPLFAALRDRGAIVTGFDKSAGMLELARRRLGDDADLQVADLGSPLPFPDDAFDDATASLVLHYLQDWGPPLAELRRVLKPGGPLIVSVDHPFAITLMHREADCKAHYFATRDYNL